MTELDSSSLGLPTSQADASIIQSSFCRAFLQCMQANTGTIPSYESFYPVPSSFSDSSSITLQSNTDLCLPAGLMPVKSVFCSFLPVCNFVFNTRLRTFPPSAF
jgi:hypothetical protein